VRLIILLVLAGSGSLARATEYQPGTQPRTTPAGSLQAGDNVLPPSLQLERASYCLDCHQFGVVSGASTSPGALWLGTMMANAARDPLMYAALAIANQDVPGIGGDYCLRCHSPAGFTAGHTTPNPGNPPNNYPCHSYVMDSPDQCRCIDGPCTIKDECRETPDRIANGYCVVAFDDRIDPNFKGHPAVPGKHQFEPYEQTPTQDSVGDTLDVFDDTEGLNCGFCHRVDPAIAFTRKSGGNYHLSTDSTQQVGWATPRSRRFGPYGNQYTNCTNSNTNTPAIDCAGGTPHGHDIGNSTLHTQSEFCGQCHDVTNPILNRLSTAGVDMGFKMPIERTFSEWQASDFGKPANAAFKTCQGCHMPKPSAPGGVCTASDDPVRFPYARNRPGVEDAHQHMFTGGNVWLPNVFANVMPPMNPDAGAGAGDPQWFFDLINGANRQAAYLAVAQEATATLQSAATLAITNPPAGTTAGGMFSFGVRVTNNTGHKLPTGYPEGRRMWLQVIAGVPGEMGADPFFQSGAYDDTTGVLTKDAQAKIYEVELSVAGKTAPPNPPEFHFVGNQIVWKDNRIPPAGFDPTLDATTWPEIAPVGATYPTDGNGHLVNYDDTPYTVAVPPFATGNVMVTVRLVYQTTSKDYIDFLRSANTTNGRGQDMTRIWQNHGRGPWVEMASTTFMVNNTAPCVPTTEICDGKDNDCDGVVDNGDVCVDLSVPPDDLSAPPPDDMAMTMDDGGNDQTDMMLARPKPTGCGVSVAGADWSDLGPLGILIAGALLVARRWRFARRES
jgi:hypothetical protein